MPIIRSFIARSKDKAVHFSDNIDQFGSSDFFKADSGLELCDFNVFAKQSADPAFREKMEKYMIENEVQGFDPSVSDEDVFNSIESKYLTKQNILADLRNRISTLRDKEFLDSQKKEPEKDEPASTAVNE